MKALRTTAFVLAFLIGLPLVYSAWFSAPTSEWVSSWEISKSGYSIAEREYSKLSQAGRAEARKVMAKGYLDSNDLRKIIDIALVEDKSGKGVSMSASEKYETDDETFNAKLWRNLSRTSLDSKAKNALFNMATADNQSKG